MKDLILLHGALGASSEFQRFEHLLKNHFKVHKFDFTGHGQNSSDQPFSMQLFAKDLENFLIENQLDKPQVFGYSMGGYVAYTLAKNNTEVLGDIMSLGTKLKWDDLIAKLETSKLIPEKIEEKIPKYAQYLDRLHIDWKDTMKKTVQLMLNLGAGDALTFQDFSKIKNKCYIGLGDMDEMVSCQETINVDAALLNSHYYKLPKSRHPLAQLDAQVLADKIFEFLG